MVKLAILIQSVPYPRPCALPREDAEKVKEVQCPWLLYIHKHCYNTRGYTRQGTERDAKLYGAGKEQYLKTFHKRDHLSCQDELGIKSRFN